MTRNLIANFIITIFLFSCTGTTKVETISSSSNIQGNLNKPSPNIFLGDSALRITKQTKVFSFQNDTFNQMLNISIISKDSIKFIYKTVNKVTNAEASVRGIALSTGVTEVDNDDDGNAVTVVLYKFLINKNYVEIRLSDESDTLAQVITSEDLFHKKFPASSIGALIRKIK